MNGRPFVLTGFRLAMFERSLGEFSSSVVDPTPLAASHRVGPVIGSVVQAPAAFIRSIA
jgi:hypothetical protein